MPDLDDLLSRYLDRIQRARMIADDLRRDERLHRLAMAMVFALEDSYEALLKELDRGNPIHVVIRSSDIG